jgi:Na+-transporting methylmalonyl-CoA/oxaloacetate decarboxylase gamma subunit
MMMLDSKKMYTGTQVCLYISIFIIIDLMVVSIWLFTSTADDTFFSHFSFASTVASIILSILAIFMSVMGEVKTQVIRDRIENETKEITNLTERLEKRMIDVLTKIKAIDDNTADIKAALTEHPDDVQLTSIKDDNFVSNNKEL